MNKTISTLIVRSDARSISFQDETLRSAILRASKTVESEEGIRAIFISGPDGLREFNPTSLLHAANSLLAQSREDRFKGVLRMLEESRQELHDLRPFAPAPRIQVLLREAMDLLEQTILEESLKSAESIVAGEQG